MKVVVADKFESDGIDQLKRLGCDVHCEPALSGDTLVEAVRKIDPRVLVVRSTKVPAAVIEAGHALGLIVRAGAGFNTIDVTAASANSVFVANCPGKNASAVAELTMGLILSLDRRIPDNVQDLRAGTWAKKKYSKAAGLKGRTLGVIGLGQIGREVVRRAQAFDMWVMAWSRSLAHDLAADLGVVYADSPEEVASKCDIISVHLAANSDTRGLVNAELFKHMRPGATFINTARADVVDYTALADAVRDKGIRVGLDVFAEEPGGGDGTFADPIMHADGVVYGTHHIGASTDQAQAAIADETVSIIHRYLQTGQVSNCVNLCRDRPPEGVLVVRHRNQPGVLANVLGELSYAGINVREMDNVIYEGEAGACAQIRLDHRPDQDVLQRIAASNNHILNISLATPR
jgi:D-3-phosphoglycerate dehydrogenase